MCPARRKWAPLLHFIQSHARDAMNDESPFAVTVRFGVVPARLWLPARASTFTHQDAPSTPPPGHEVADSHEFGPGAEPFAS